MATERQYWDSCCFISIVNKEVGRIDHLVQLWHEASLRGRTRILTSALTIGECAHANGSEVARDEIDSFFYSKCLTLVALDRSLGNEARRLQREAKDKHGKKLPVRDSFHLAAALRGNADRMFTYDEDDLTPLSRLFMTREGKALVIEVPKWSGTIPMKLD